MILIDLNESLLGRGGSHQVMYHFTDSKYLFLLDKALWPFSEALVLTDTQTRSDNGVYPVRTVYLLFVVLVPFLCTALLQSVRGLEKDWNCKWRHTKTKDVSVGFCWISRLYSPFDFSFTSTMGC